MDWITSLFYVFAAVLLFAAVRVVTARNTVHATLYLMLAFFQAALIWMLLKAEFLSSVLVLVYLGAVMVLFLFVVMMLDINVDALRGQFWRHLPLAALVGGLMAAELASVVWQGFGQVGGLPVGQASNTKALGMLLYTEYVYPLEIAAVLLLVAIVAAIALTLRERKDSRHTDASVQVRARKADRLRVLSMPPVRRPAPDTQQDTEGDAT
jgi:NADH-quinone oxidoreductase subunit J